MKLRRIALLLQAFVIILITVCAADVGRICRNEIIDCHKKKISFKTTPIAHALPRSCRTTDRCHNLTGCPSTQNCTSSQFLDVFLDECSCKSTCQVKELVGHEDCYFFDVDYECVDECGAELSPVIMIAIAVVFVCVLVVTVLVMLIISKRRRRKGSGNRRQHDLVEPDDLLRAFDVHHKENQRFSDGDENADRNIRMSDIRQIGAQYIDASDPNSGRIFGTDAESVQRDNSQKAGDATRMCNSIGNKDDYVINENEDSKIYILKENGNLTIPRTKLNKRHPNVIIPNKDDDTSVCQDSMNFEEDVGDYDNMLFDSSRRFEQGSLGGFVEGNGNGETNADIHRPMLGPMDSDSSHAPSHEVTPPQSADITNVDLEEGDYDNVEFCGGLSQLDTSKPNARGEGLLLEDQHGEKVEGIGNQNIDHGDFGLEYDNVEFEQGCGSLVGNDTEIRGFPVDESGLDYDNVDYNGSTEEAECGLDYDNVEYNDGHGEIAKKKVHVVQDRSLSVIYEHDEGISMEGDESDETDLKSGSIRKSRGSGARASSGANENAHKVPRYDTQEPSLYQQPDYPESHNDNDVDLSAGNYDGNLYRSLEASSFQKPVDYGMKGFIPGNRQERTPSGIAYDTEREEESEMNYSGQGSNATSDNDILSEFLDQHLLEQTPYGEEWNVSDLDLESGYNQVDLTGMEQSLPDSDIFQSDEYY